MEESGLLQVSEPSHVRAIDSFLASRGTFVEVAGALGLDRTVDFQGSNLRGVDFTGSDLRGFDFTGADLRGSYGIGIVYDDTTLLDGADVQASPFRHAMFERSVRSENAGFEREYELLRKSYWADQLPYVLDRAKKSPDAADVRLMAMRLFVDSKDSGVRADMVRILGMLGLDRDEHLSFLLNVCATRTEPAVLVAAADALSAGYRDRKPAFETLLTLTSHGNEVVQMAAYQGAVRSKHLREARERIADGLSAGVSPRVRRAIARSLAPTVGAYGRTLMNSEPFAQAIATDGALSHGRLASIALAIGEHDVAVRNRVMSQARDLIELLADLGMPLRMSSMSR